MIKKWGGYEITIERCFVFGGKAGLGAGMVIHLGFQVRARSLSPISGFTGFPRFEEMVLADQDTGQAAHTADPGRRGDLEWDLPYYADNDPGYGGCPICVTSSAYTTMFAELEVLGRCVRADNPR